MKRWIISSVVTFVSVFLVSFGGALINVDWSGEPEVMLKVLGSLAASALVVAVRATVKALNEKLLLNS